MSDLLHVYVTQPSLVMYYTVLIANCMYTVSIVFTKVITKSFTHKITNRYYQLSYERL